MHEFRLKKKSIVKVTFFFKAIIYEGFYIRKKKGSIIAANILDYRDKSLPSWALFSLDPLQWNIID